MSNEEQPSIEMDTFRDSAIEKSQKDEAFLSILPEVKSVEPSADTIALHYALDEAADTFRRDKTSSSDQKEEKLIGTLRSALKVDVDVRAKVRRRTFLERAKGHGFGERLIEAIKELLDSVLRQQKQVGATIAVKVQPQEQNTSQKPKRTVGEMFQIFWKSPNTHKVFQEIIHAGLK